MMYHYSKILFCALSLILSGWSDPAFSQNPKKIVIAHRGASGYIVEHTLEAKAMAYAYGADFLEQDLCMTKDDKIVVMHDPYLNAVSNVAELFPNRKRKNGKYYIIDFTLEELRRLSLIEKFGIKDGKKVQKFPGRFPLGKSRFRVHTFEEEIEMIQGLNESTGRDVGIYPEVKQAEFHTKNGKDLSRAVLKVLKHYGYTTKSSNVFLQTFEQDDLKRIHDVLFPEMGMEVKLIQLMSGSKEFDKVKTPAGMVELAKRADGIGPGMTMIVLKGSKPGDLKISDLVTNAHAAGLKVHPYTLRKDKSALPEYAGDFDDLVDIFYRQIGVDGAFTDFPDLVVKALRKK